MPLSVRRWDAGYAPCVVEAVVREWDDAEGWGVVDSPETPGGCWTHYSHVDMAGYRKLVPGERVDLVWETFGQDGYAFRAVQVIPKP
jgi:cold shock protein